MNDTEKGKLIEDFLKFADEQQFELAGPVFDKIGGTYRLKRIHPDDVPLMIVDFLEKQNEHPKT